MKEEEEEEEGEDAQLRFAARSVVVLSVRSDSFSLKRKLSLIAACMHACMHAGLSISLLAWIRPDQLASF